VLQLALALLWAARVAAAVQGTEPGLLARAQAAMPDVAHGGEVYRERCARCHRAHGNGTGERQFPQIAGQRQEYLLEQMVEIAQNERFAPKMHRVLDQAELADPQTLRDLAAYLSAQHHDEHGEHGDGRQLGRGRRIYDTRCASCHGEQGQGRAAEPAAPVPAGPVPAAPVPAAPVPAAPVPAAPIPAVAGQNFTYLMDQLKGFAAGHRSRAPPELIRVVEALSPDDREAVSDFISRMP